MPSRRECRGEWPFQYGTVVEKSSFRYYHRTELAGSQGRGPFDKLRAVSEVEPFSNRGPSP